MDVCTSLRMTFNSATLISAPSDARILSMPCMLLQDKPVSSEEPLHPVYPITCLASAEGLLAHHAGLGMQLGLVQEFEQVNAIFVQASYQHPYPFLHSFGEVVFPFRLGVSIDHVHGTNVQPRIEMTCEEYIDALIAGLAPCLTDAQHETLAFVRGNILSKGKEKGKERMAFYITPEFPFANAQGQINTQALVRNRLRVVSADLI